MKSTLISIDHITLIEGPAFSTPAVLLQNYKLNRVLPIFIGELEAGSIAIGLQNLKTERPLSHDLLLNTIREFGGQVDKVIIESLINHTYFAKILVKCGGNLSEIDSRPSDAIALAIRAGVKVFVDQYLFEKYGQTYFSQQEMRPRKSVKENFTQEEIEKMRIILKNARQREEKSN